MLGVDLALERGDEIENLVERTSALDAEAHQFKKRATVLKKKLW
jgi:hypothetical protein